MSFDLKKYLAEGRLFEEPGFDKDKWIYLTDEEKEEFANDIFGLISNAYKDIGGHANYDSPADVTGDERDADYMVIDLDDDPEFDALKISKEKAAGTKSAGMGHDGSGPAKSAAVGITSIMLKKPGYYIEVSGKLKDILVSRGVPIVTDEETIRKVLKGKEITMNDDGTYNRNLGGEMHTKTMMGNPNV
jgi:hypothetical protein